MSLLSKQNRLSIKLNDPLDSTSFASKNNIMQLWSEESVKYFTKLTAKTDFPSLLLPIIVGIFI